MKKRILTAVLTLFLYSTSFAQDPILLDNDWYLTSLIIDGTEYVPEDTGVNFVGNYSMDDPYPFTLKYDALHLNSANLQLVPNEDKFEIIEIVSLTMGICNGNASCITIGSLYEAFFSDNVNQIIDYEYGIIPNGTLSLTLTDSNNNRAIYNEVPLLGQLDFDTASFVIYPNPVSDMLFISSENTSIESIVIYDLNGRQALSEGGASQVDVSLLTNGMYFIEIFSSEGRAFQKFIKR